MARHISSLSARARLAYGIGCIAIGCYPMAVALGFIPIDEAPSTAPAWVIAGAGMAFVIAGFMILMAKHSRANDLLAGILLLLFGVMGVWVSVFSSSDGFSGGWPFLSRETNEFIGRCLFGFGAFISFSMSAYAFRRAATAST